MPNKSVKSELIDYLIVTSLTEIDNICENNKDQVTCDDINCGPKQVCLIDLLTHKPRCTSCRYKCSRKRRPSSSHFDEGKICGFNNRTYNSWCEMRKDSCSTGFYIDVKYGGDCH